MNVLELFAGIGGLSLGLQRAGMTIVGHVEIDPFCRAVLHKHWPEVPVHDDVRTAVAWWLSQPRPRVDVVAGGYPCQPESNAGKRRGHHDARWLWPEMARVIHAVRPRYVIGENVSGHRTKGLRFVLRDLERLGYTARPGTLSAGEMGAPHRRQRIFVIAELAHPVGELVRVEPGRSCGPDRQEPPEPGHHGATQPLADTERVAGHARWAGDAEQGPQGRHADRGGLVGDVADPDSPGREPRGGLGPAGPPAERASWWAAEPDVGRVAHGVPDRVDRLRALGNAVVPQVAEHIGRIILDNHASG